MNNLKEKNQRIEKDSLGEIKVPINSTYGSYTARVLKNFKVSGVNVPEFFLRNYVGIKRIYAHINYKHKKFEKTKAEAIINACDQLLQLDSAEFMAHFPIDIYQSGGGTSTNMMLNEVIANIAEESVGGKKGQYKMVHPNDDVNMSQSSNDTFPGVIRITLYFESLALLEQISNLIDVLEEKATQFSSVTKVGRTHLQDALPIKLGSEFKAFAVTLKKDLKFIESMQKQLLELPFGATAVGTKQNVSTELRNDLIKELSEELNVKFTKPGSYFESVSSSSDFQKFASAVNTISIDLIKICNDLRLLASGPKAGISEIMLPEVQPGSSIMPGKVNPSILEAMEMIAFDVMGKSHTIQIATSQAQLQLQQFSPAIAWNILDATKILANGLKMLNKKCIGGIKVNEKAIEKHLKSSYVYATQYSEKLGYDKVAQLVKEAQKKDLDLRGILESALKELE